MVKSHMAMECMGPSITIEILVASVAFELLLAMSAVLVFRRYRRAAPKLSVPGSGEKPERSMIGLE